MSLLLSLLFTNAFALDCSDIRRVQMRVEVHATNLANAQVTRDAEGQPYRIRNIDCANDTCHIRSEEKFSRKYLPLHPDADSLGYVRFPDVDPIRERARLNAAAHELRMLAKAAVCNDVRLGTDSLTELSLEYSTKEGALKSERLSFSDRQEVSGWTRHYQSGHEEKLTF